MNSFLDIWDNVLKRLKIQFYNTNAKHAFDTYITVLTPEYESNGMYYFKVDNKYFKTQILERFKQDIAYELERETGRPADITVYTNDEMDSAMNTRQHYPSVRNTISLNPKYTFDTFVVGKSNQFAHAASKAVAKTPGQVYNPLFFHGGVGLGKTHLMHAIGNEIIKNNPNANIIYITTESFTNEMVEGIRSNTMPEFRAKFRNADVFMLDDIQFISRTNSTQEELFHTFSTLYENEKQIILSADRAPNDIARLEDRLTSRFNWGMLTEIGSPDYETRIAILKSKSEDLLRQSGCTLPIDEDAYQFIAYKDDTNIRDLEGALRKVIMQANLMNMEVPLSSITREVAAVALTSFFKEPVRKKVTPELILSEVCSFYNITIDDINSKSRSKSVAFPRQVAMYLMRDILNLTFPKIGEEIGGRDHSTVMHGIEKITTQLKSDKELSNTIADIKDKLK